MIWLFLGLVAFGGIHLWKRLSPGTRARLGDPGKGVVAVVSILGIWMMARGYGRWDGPQVWIPAAWLTHLNNVMVLVGFYLFVASGARTWAARVNRHPQLTGVSLWAAAHLLVNGDLASIVLFGGLLVWSVAEILLINRAVPDWTPPPPAPMAKEVTIAVATLVLYAAVGYVHGWIGPWPFGPA